MTVEGDRPRSRATFVKFSTSPVPSAAGQKVGLPMADLPGAATRQQESRLRLLDQSMYLVKEHRQLLDSVNGHEAFAAGLDHFLELARPVAQSQEVVRFEQIDHQGLPGELSTDQEALSSGSRPQKEVGLLGEQPGKMEKAGVVHLAILCDTIE